MLTPKQIKIFEAFLKKPYKELTYKEIKESLKEIKFYYTESYFQIP